MAINCNKSECVEVKCSKEYNANCVTLSMIPSINTGFYNFLNRVGYSDSLITLDTFIKLYCKDVKQRNYLIHCMYERTENCGLSCDLITTGIIVG
jgi:hypothetical protein